MGGVKRDTVDGDPMMINEMTREASFEFLQQKTLGRVACSHDGQSYVTPTYYRADGNYLYGFATVGRKIEWMRANPRVCVLVDDVEGSEHWTSIIAFGRFEELTTAPEHDDARRRAYSLLQSRPAWWEPGFAKTRQEVELQPLYYRIHLEKISGRRAAGS